MQLSISRRPSPGVGTLMYVGDVATNPPLPNNEVLGAGVLAAALALFSRQPLVKLAGAAVAGFVGYGVYQAKK